MIPVNLLMLILRAVSTAFFVLSLASTSASASTPPFFDQDPPPSWVGVSIVSEKAQVTSRIRDWKNDAEKIEDRLKHECKRRDWLRRWIPGDGSADQLLLDIIARQPHLLSLSPEQPLSAADLSFLLRQVTSAIHLTAEERDYLERVEDQADVDSGSTRILAMIGAQKFLIRVSNRLYNEGVRLFRDRATVSGASGSFYASEDLCLEYTVRTMRDYALSAAAQSLFALYDGARLEQRLY